MTPRYAVGDRVRVAESRPPAGPRKPHIRTPHYVRGKTGEIERICGAFRNPETLAYGGDGLPRRPLYRVRFRQALLWPGYAGAPGAAAEVEIHEPWLDPAGPGEEARP